jgi:ABC-type polysaccharide/polyol phosphate export permease
VLIRTVDFGVGLVILAVAILLAGESLTWSALWLLPLFCLHLLFVVGLAMPLAALNLFFHDVRFLVGVVLNLWFFFTPIFYSVELVPSSYRFLYDLNPMARFVGAYREAVLLHGSPPAASLLIATLATLGVLTLGSYVFRKLEPRFADRI